MPVVNQVFECCLKFGVELLESGILFHMQVEEVAEGVMEVFEPEGPKPLVQLLEHLLGFEV